MVYYLLWTNSTGTIKMKKKSKNGPTKKNFFTRNDFPFEIVKEKDFLKCLIYINNSSVKLSV